MINNIINEYGGKKWKPSKSQAKEFAKNMQDPSFAADYYKRKEDKANKRRSGSDFDYNSAGGEYIPTKSQYDFVMNNMNKFITPKEQNAANMVISGYTSNDKVHHDYIHIVNSKLRGGNTVFENKISIIESITKTVIKKLNEEIATNRDMHRSTYYATLLDCPRFVHAYHLEMKKHSYHVELDELYKELPELVDVLIENEQGNYGLVKGLRMLEFNRNYDMSDGNSDPIKYLEELKQFIMVGRKIIYDPERDSAFYSDIDNLISTIDSTLYKLKHLP